MAQRIDNLGRRGVLLLLSATASLFIQGAALAQNEATIDQVNPTSRTVQCSGCAVQKLTTTAPIAFLPLDEAGPADTEQTIQFGSYNAAASLSFGKGNYIGQFQLGDRDQSVVGVVANQASVTVVQNGSDLQSNFWVYGTPLAPIGIYQGPHSAPVNAALFTDKNGTEVLLPGNATTIVRQ